MQTSDFSFITDKHTRFMVEDAYKAAESTPEAWTVLRTWEPANGFMFTHHPVIDAMGKKLYDGHSGASYGFTMRIMQRLAKVGYDEFRREWLTVECSN